METPSQVCLEHLKSNTASLWGNSIRAAPIRRSNSGNVLLRQDSKICLTVALVVMAYILSIQHELENKVKKKKIYKNKPS